MATIAADASTGRLAVPQRLNPGGRVDRSPGASFDSAIDALTSIANDIGQGGSPSGRSSVARVLAQVAVSPTRPLQTPIAGPRISASTPAENGAVGPKVVVNGPLAEHMASTPSSNSRDPVAIPQPAGMQATIERPLDDVAVVASRNPIPMPLLPNPARPLGKPHTTYTTNEVSTPTYRSPIHETPNP